MVMTADAPTTDESTADSETTDDVKAKRERVDLETLDPNEKVTLLVTMPAGMKLELTKRGETDTIVASAYARNLLAQAIGYDIPESFTERAREHKYANEDERKAAVKATAKIQRDQVKAVLAAIKAGRISQDVLAVS